MFRGWRVVGGAFGVMFLSFACAYSFPAFFDPLQNEFEASRGDLSFVFGLGSAGFFLVGAFAGIAADRMDPRIIIGLGMIMVGAGPIAASFATALWQVQLAMGLGIGLGVGFAYVPSVGPVQRWFVRRRGLASGIAISGIGVGTFAAPLIAREIMVLSDWRTAYLVLGIGAIVLGLAATTQVVGSPQRVGLAPDGDSPGKNSPAVPASGAEREPDFTIGEAMRSRPFLLLFVSTFILGWPLFVPFVHLAPDVSDQGYSTSTAVTVASLIGFGSLAGRFLMGGLADRFGRLNTFVAMYFGLALMFLVWLSATQAWMLGAFALVYGACYGGYVALAPSVIADFFGNRNISGITGIVYASVAIGVLLGPAIVGYIHDATGDYSGPLAGCAILLVLAAVVASRLKKDAKT